MRLLYASQSSFGGIKTWERYIQICVIARCVIKGGTTLNIDSEELDETDAAASRLPLGSVLML